MFGYLSDLSEVRRNSELDSSTRSVRDAAQKRGISFHPVCFYQERYDHEIYDLNFNGKVRRIDITRPDTSSHIALQFTVSKALTQYFLKKFNFPNPGSMILASLDEAVDVFHELNGACVIKPVNGAGGEGITVNISCIDEMEQAVSHALQYDRQFIIERYYPGYDYRFLVIDYKLVAVARRMPPYVVGDGESTILQLIEAINAQREGGRKGILSKIVVDCHAESCLAKQGKTLSCVLAEEERITVRSNANLNTGGYSIAYDVGCIHPSITQCVESLSHALQLPVSGIDVMCSDLSLPLGPSNGTILEVNARPRFRMHEHPSEGAPVNVSGFFLDMLFPETMQPTSPGLLESQSSCIK